MKRLSIFASLAFVFVSGPALATEIVIEGNDAMQFNIKEFRVKAGEEVTLTLKHVGKMPAAAMGHNVVILKKGIDAMSWGMGILGKGATLQTGYLPTDQSEIIAHTKMLGGGESDTIKFTAPSDKGNYPFLCTFLGHVATMRGTMIVE